MIFAEKVDMTGFSIKLHIKEEKAELRKEENFIDQKSSSIAYLQTDYLNLYSSSGSGKNNGRANLVHTK